MKSKFKAMLDELYEYTLMENERELTAQEKSRYVELAETLQENNVPIEFPIVL